MKVIRSAEDSGPHIPGVVTVGTYDGVHVRLYVDGVEIGNGTPTNVGIRYGLPTHNYLVIDLTIPLKLDQAGYPGDKIPTRKLLSLKNSLGISGEFAFSFKNIISGEIAVLSVSKQIPVGVNVEAKEFPVRVINDQGVIQELIFNLMVW